MKKLIATLSIAAAAVAATVAFAGPGYGPGAGAGTGCTAADTATPCTGGAGMGPGTGMRGMHGHGGGLAFELMTPEERAAHRSYMMGLKSLDECKTYVAAHHAAMVARATAKGITLPEPRFDACERMQAHGRFG